MVSDEPFWRGLSSILPTLRLRLPTAPPAAPRRRARRWRPTFRSRTPSSPAPARARGWSRWNPGNQGLRPEKGTEFEAGFDAGFLSDRLGLELTYFDKTTTDLLLRRPVAPSTGAGSNPFVNIGKVTNSGLEYSLRGTLLTLPNFRWEARVSGSTLKNELVSLGDIEPFGTAPRFAEGHSLGYFSTRTIRELVTAAGDARCPVVNSVHVPCAIVSDTNEFLGNSLPTYEGNFGTTVTLFRNFQVSGQIDWKGGFRIYNNTAQFRERAFRTAAIAVLGDTVASQQELLDRYGPFVAESGGAVPYTNVNGAYFQPGDFVRLRELAATFFLPADVARRVGAGSASLTVGARNLALWTKYGGPDPEVLSAATGAGAGTASFAREDFLTVPQPRRVVVKLNLSF